jgi:hypothetical protein
MSRGRASESFSPCAASALKKSERKRTRVDAGHELGFSLALGE